MANIKKLKENGQDIVPITHEQAVLDSNGVTLDSKLNAINNAIASVDEKIANISTGGTVGNGKNNIVESFNFSPTEANEILSYIPYIAQAGEVLKITITSDNEGETEHIYGGIVNDSGSYIENEFTIPILGIPTVYISSHNIGQIVLWSERATTGTYTMTIERIVQSSSLNYSFSIIGDSISTFEGWIPENNVTWYPSENNDVKNVENTWWKQLSDKNGMKLLVNNSYSGSSLCTTGYGEGEDSTRISFVNMIKENTSGETSDIIFIQGGTNDVWGNCPSGSELFLDYTEYTENDLKQVIPAFCYIVDYLKTFNPNSKIVYIQMPEVLDSDYSKGIMKACLHYDIECIFFEELSTQDGHPDIEGMNTIYKRVIADLCSNEFNNTSPYATKDDLLTKADKSEIPTKISQLTNDSGFITNEITELNILSLVLGNYQIKYNETNDTLDFIYNGVIDEPGTDESKYEILDLDWLVGYSLDGTSGEPFEDSADAITDFIFYDNFSEYLLSKDTVQNFRYYFYDKDKSYISRSDSDNNLSTTDSKVVFPSNTAYFRLKLVLNEVSGSDLNSHVSLKKTVTFVNNGLSMYINSDDVATYGSVRDISGNQTVTNHGASLTSDNKYLNFISSESDYIDTDLVPNLSTWSVELYFCFTTTPTSTEVVTSWGSAWDNKVRLAYSGSSEGCGIESNDEQKYILFSGSELLSPHHLIITMNNGALTSYLDGVKTVLCASGGIQTSHTGTLKIGTRYEATKEFANINLRTFRFYDGKALTEEEALQNYNYEINRNSETGTGGTTQEEEVSLVWEVGNLNSSGAEESIDYTIRSNFVTIEDNYAYSFYLESALSDPTGIRVYFYDTNKTFISRTDGDELGYTTGTDISIDLPTNAVYMRFKSNINTSTTLNNINALFTLRKRKTAIPNIYVREGLSMYIDAADVATYGSIRDISGNQTITNNGVSTTLDNGCLNFVASESDYIDCGFKPNLTQWSVETYFYFTNMPTEAETLLGWGASGNRTAIAIWDNDDFMIAINDKTQHIIMPTAPTSLAHLVLTYNNGRIIAYVNGIKTELATNANVMTSQGSNLMLGTKYSASSEFGDIHLKSLRFYDGKVLSDEEALQNYNYEINRNENIIQVTWIDNKKPDSSTGELVEAESNACTEFIAYNSSYNYTLAIDTVAYFRIFYYDSSQSYISNDSIADNFNGVITPPENTAYMRLKLGRNTVEFTDLDNHVIFKKVLK